MLPDPQSLSQYPCAIAKLSKLSYAYLEAGNGPPILFLHGFPDMASTWDKTLAKFSSTHRCIAPFLRGYYPTDLAADKDYAAKTVAKDLIEFADHLGLKKFVVVGHDWGASVAYALANLAPDRVTKLVTIAIPHPAMIKPTPWLLYKARHFIKFRNPKSSLEFTRKHNFKYIDTLVRRWAPNWKESGPTRRKVKQTFALPGRLAAALGYYWSFHANLKNEELTAFYNKIPIMPTLAFAGKTDGALLMKPFREMEKKFPPSFRLRVYATAGHFLHQEDPDFFEEELRKFIKS